MVASFKWSRIIYISKKKNKDFCKLQCFKWTDKAGLTRLIKTVDTTFNRVYNFFFFWIDVRFIMLDRCRIHLSQVIRWSKALSIQPWKTQTQMHLRESKQNLSVYPLIFILIITCQEESRLHQNYQRTVVQST